MTPHTWLFVLLREVQSFRLVGFDGNQRVHAAARVAAPVRVLTCPPLLPLHLQVTCLSLGTRRGRMPQGVGALANLQRFIFWRDEEVYNGQEEEAVLPHPHSLHRLRSLGIDWRIAAAGVPALAAMPALKELWLRDTPHEVSVPEEQWGAFWAWAAAHPPLRRLFLDSAGTDPPVFAPEPPSQALPSALERLQRSRPGLAMQRDEACPSCFLELFHTTLWWDRECRPVQPHTASPLHAPVWRASRPPARLPARLPPAGRPLIHPCLPTQLDKVFALPQTHPPTPPHPTPSHPQHVFICSHVRASGSSPL